MITITVNGPQFRESFSKLNRQVQSLILESHPTPEKSLEVVFHHFLVFNFLNIHIFQLQHLSIFQIFNLLQFSIKRLNKIQFDFNIYNDLLFGERDRDRGKEGGQ